MNKEISEDVKTPSDSLDHVFAKLSPDFVIDAIEAQGFLSDGRQIPLNSYENRVYQVGLEEDENEVLPAPIIAKFYRPDRWTKAQILEEHAFCSELAEASLPVIAPTQKNNTSLFEYQGFFIALFPRKGGRAPDLDNFDNLYSLGQYLAKIHAIGEQHSFEHRPNLNVQSYGNEPVQFVGEHFIPKSLRESYCSLTRDILEEVNTQIDYAGDIRSIRTHGDCHLGNVLWRDDTPNFVDFDDSRMAPAVQDLWMLMTANERREKSQQLSEVIEGYELFREFDRKELALIEPLRTLRMLHYCGWLAKRWDDPSFPMHFSWFNTERYWGEHILSLREQFAVLQEPCIHLQ